MNAFNLSEAQKLAKTRIDPFYIVFMVLMHSAAVASFFMFTWTNFFVALALYIMSGTGITIGYHRLLTHKSFKTPKWVEYVWATLGTLATQGSPVEWVAQHRQHHLESDDELDPHNINEGFMWAHMWWIFKRYPKWYEEGVKNTFAPDLLKDSYYRWLDKYAYIPSVIVGLALLAFGGIGMFLWGFCLRLIIVYHVTWFVNSAAHKWGYRYFKSEMATNNWWVALLTFGEGWHNNHHAFPTSARHGLRFWEIDFSWITIWTMSKIGLADKLKTPAKQSLPWSKGKGDAISEQSA
ncbi:MAG TPA: fatty acid desaturase [Bdellovibrionota bacterium]|jgi:stearoyl-CoA desaturase (delta-9 desaturase)|nr:fatty acid desaturase [Bdellovibrionota bacterium]